MSADLDERLRQLEDLAWKLTEDEARKLEPRLDRFQQLQLRLMRREYLLIEVEAVDRFFNQEREDR